jgi:hypothetical protein
MSDPFQHVNRKGDIYYLQSNAGSSGQFKYSFSRNPSAQAVVALPDGYEVREHPETAQVVIRRHKPSQIHVAEKTQLEESIRQQAKGLLFMVDLEDRSLIVYTSDMDADVRLMALRGIAPMDEETALRTHHWMLTHARYSKMLRFTLTDRMTRRFSLERWCFSGSIDNWILIDGDSTLPELADKYVRHLAQESFFELMGFQSPNSAACAMQRS